MAFGIDFNNLIRSDMQISVSELRVFVQAKEHFLKVLVLFSTKRHVIQHDLHVFRLSVLVGKLPAKSMFDELVVEPLVLLAFLILRQTATY